MSFELVYTEEHPEMVTRHDTDSGFAIMKTVTRQGGTYYVGNFDQVYINNFQNQDVLLSTTATFTVSTAEFDDCFDPQGEKIRGELVITSSQKFTSAYVYSYDGEPKLLTKYPLVHAQTFTASPEHERGCVHRMYIKATLQTFEKLHKEYKQLKIVLQL